MAIANSVRYTLAGLGTAGLRGQTITANWTAGTTVAATIGPLAQKVNCGVLRTRVSGMTGTGAVLGIAVTGSDGTTTIYIGTASVTAGVVNQGVDLMTEFQSELNLQTFVATITFSAAPTAAVLDFEVWGQENSGGP